MTSPPSALADELVDVAARLAREAGDMALAGRKRGLREVSTKTSRTDMVTEYDKASESLIFEGLRTLRPLDSIVGEEGASHVGSNDITWFIDPIDGTSNFLYDIPMWAVSIGARQGGEAIAGAVYIAAAGEMFTATRGGGARLNDSPIGCNRDARLETALIATGFSYAPESRPVQARRVARMIGRIRDIRRFGAAAVDMCYVACGRLDGYFEENLHEWDIAAGDLIAREAGCLTGDFRGGSIRPAETMTASPAIFEALGRLIVESTVADQQ
jgi:fructose-1,6-bisphosphatase/inositol monophosphatase family enzyme